MNIVVLDGHSLNPGDLSWEKLKALGNGTVYKRTPPEKTLKRAEKADIILTNKVVLDKKIISKLPRLKYICVLATGYNVVDISFARKKNIPVSNIPAYSTESVAQLVFALLLELTTRVGSHSKKVFDGKWTKSKDFCFWNTPLIELNSLTMGIVGYGKIGKSVIKKARAFGMKIRVFSRTLPETKNKDFFFCSLKELLQKSDIVSLHCSLTEKTKKLIFSKELKMMKKTAFLINTGRGALLDEKAVLKALNEGLIAGAAMDVLFTEPPLKDNPLLMAKNCFITPHFAWATTAARKRLLKIAIENTKNFIFLKKSNIFN